MPLRNRDPPTDTKRIGMQSMPYNYNTGFRRLASELGDPPLHGSTSAGIVLAPSTKWVSSRDPCHRRNQWSQERSLNALERTWRIPVTRLSPRSQFHHRVDQRPTFPGAEDKLIEQVGVRARHGSSLQKKSVVPLGLCKTRKSTVPPVRTARLSTPKSGGKRTATPPEFNQRHTNNCHILHKAGPPFVLRAFVLRAFVLRVSFVLLHVESRRQVSPLRMRRRHWRAKAPARATGRRASAGTLITVLNQAITCRTAQAWHL